MESVRPGLDHLPETKQFYASIIHVYLGHI